MKRSPWFIPLALCAISCAADPRSDLEPRAGDAGMMHAHVIMAHFDEADVDHDGQPTHTKWLHGRRESTAREH